MPSRTVALVWHERTDAGAKYFTVCEFNDSTNSLESPLRFATGAPVPLDQCSE
jgi:hypothetical protein